MAADWCVWTIFVIEFGALWILAPIARELVETVGNNVTIGGMLQENGRARLHVPVKLILRKHGYPTDNHEGAARKVQEQAEVMSTG